VNVRPLLGFTLAQRVDRLIDPWEMEGWPAVPDR